MRMIDICVINFMKDLCQRSWCSSTRINRRSKLISFDSIAATGLDTVTLDDLNDDDFDPRAFDQGNSGDSSDTSDDFNPRGSAALQAGPVIKPADAVHQVSDL